MTQEKTLQALHSENERLGLYKDAYAQRTWVGLTTADQKEIQRQSVYVEGAIRMTEAKLKERNT